MITYRKDCFFFFKLHRNSFLKVSSQHFLWYILFALRFFWHQSLQYLSVGNVYTYSCVDANPGTYLYFVVTIYQKQQRNVLHRFLWFGCASGQSVGIASPAKTCHILDNGSCFTYSIRDLVWKQSVVKATCPRLTGRSNWATRRGASEIK